jgi:hypothetical protein
VYGAQEVPTAGYWQQEATRYTGPRTEVRGQWRLSPDGRAAVRATPPAQGDPLRRPESPIFYAHPDLIHATNQAYERAHSTLRLYPDEHAGLPPELDGLGLVRAVPGFSPPTGKPVPLLRSSERLPSSSRGGWSGVQAWAPADDAKEQAQAGRPKSGNRLGSGNPVIVPIWSPTKVRTMMP